MRVGVIGCGAAGTSVLDALVRIHDGRRPIEVTVFEADKQFGAGRAYQADSEAALVNQPARHMSLRIHQPDHFLRWLDDQKFVRPDDPDFYVARSLFGRYLEDSFRRTALAGVDRNIRTLTCGRRVVGLRRAETEFAVRTEGR